MILFILSSLFPSKINKLLIRLVRPSCRGNQLSLPPRSALQRWLSLGVQYFPLIPEVVLPPSNVQQSFSSHHLSVSNIFPFYRKERLNIMELKARLNEKHFSNQIHKISIITLPRHRMCFWGVDCWPPGEKNGFELGRLSASATSARLPEEPARSYQVGSWLICGRTKDPLGNNGQPILVALSLVKARQRVKNL